jgi:hypothetical protein
MRLIAWTGVEVLRAATEYRCKAIGQMSTS